MFAGVSSAWSRMLVFFATCFLAYAVGYGCVSLGYNEHISLASIPLLPAAWFFGIFQAFSYSLGVLYVILLLITLLLLGLTDVSALHPVVWLFVAQMWNTFFIQRFLIDHWDYQLFEIKPFSSNGFLVAGIISAAVLVPYLARVLLSWKNKQTEHPHPSVRL